MICRSCGTQNFATSLRCIQCGTGLVKEMSETSEAYRTGAGVIDSRIYGRVGSFGGFFLTYLVLRYVLEDLDLDAREIYGGALAASLVCGLAGRLIAYKKWK